MSLMVVLEHFYPKISIGFFYLFHLFILVLISYRSIMVGFQAFWKSLLIPRSGPKTFAIKKEEEEKGREKKGKHRGGRVLVCGSSSGTDTETGKIMHCVLQFCMLKTKLTYPGTAEVTFVLFLLSPLRFIFPFFSLFLCFSALRTLTPTLSIHFPCSLPHFKSNLLSVIRRTTAQLSEALYRDP